MVELGFDKNIWVQNLVFLNTKDKQVTKNDDRVFAEIDKLAPWNSNQNKILLRT